MKRKLKRTTLLPHYFCLKPLCHVMKQLSDGPCPEQRLRAVHWLPLGRSNNVK